ncbi:MAG: hypothetical protein ABEI31_11465 [Halodesulfurarchaeum sp.]
MSILRLTPPLVCWSAGGALLVSHYGPLAVVNPFRLLLAMVTALRYLVRSLLGVQVGYALFPITSEQSLNAVAGLFGLGGWVLLFVVIMLMEGAAKI